MRLKRPLSSDRSTRSLLNFLLRSILFVWIILFILFILFELFLVWNCFWNCFLHFVCTLCLPSDPLSNACRMPVCLCVRMFANVIREALAGSGQTPERLECATRSGRSKSNLEPIESFFQLNHQTVCPPRNPLEQKRFCSPALCRSVLSAILPTLDSDRIRRTETLLCPFCVSTKFTWISCPWLNY